MKGNSVDPELVRRARAGDSGAWDQLFERYQRPLYVFAVEMLQEESIGLDVVQETFLSACRHLDNLREPARFGSWLFGIAHQKCQQHARRRSVASRWTGALSADDGDRMDEGESDTDGHGPGAGGGLERFGGDDAQLDPACWLIRAEQEAELLTCLANLPEAQRALLLLRFVDDFSLAEIADITGVPVGTVKSRLHHARQSFRHLFERLPV